MILSYLEPGKEFDFEYMDVTLTFMGNELDFHIDNPTSTILMNILNQNFEIGIIDFLQKGYDGTYDELLIPPTASNDMVLVRGLIAATRAFLDTDDFRRLHAFLVEFTDSVLLVDKTDQLSNYSRGHRLLAFRSIVGERFAKHFSYAMTVKPNVDFFDGSHDTLMQYLDFFKNTLGPEQSNTEKMNERLEQLRGKSRRVDLNASIDFESITDAAAHLFLRLFKQDIIIKKCANCGRYFIPLNRSDTIYCENSSPQDSSKTCKDQGAMFAYQRKLKESEADQLYRNVYQAKQMLIRRNPDMTAYKSAFETFKNQVKQWKADLKIGSKSEDDYIQWLKQAREKKV